MHFLQMVGVRKRGATEPPFFGTITEEDGTPTDLTNIVDMKFRLGTPGMTPLIDAVVTIVAPETGEWKFLPTEAQADALPVGEILCHLVINWAADIVEFVPFDHYFKLEILESL